MISHHSSYAPGWVESGAHGEVWMIFHAIGFSVHFEQCNVSVEISLAQSLRFVCLCVEPGLEPGIVVFHL